MPRLARNNIETPYCHVIVQGINKEYIFKEMRFKKEYIEIVKRNIQDEKVKIISYCIMDNHAHFLVYTENQNDLTKLMQRTNTSYAKFYNKFCERVGYVFRDRYFTQMILGETQLYNCIVYIHYNPVKANLVRRPEEYNYSSYQEYIGKIKKLITEESIKLAFGTVTDYIKEFEEIHCKQEIEDIADTNEEIISSKELIKEFLQKKNKSIEEIMCNQNEFCELLLQLRHKGKLSLRAMSDIFNIKKDKLNKIINLEIEKS